MEMVERNKLKRPSNLFPMKQILHFVTDAIWNLQPLDPKELHLDCDQRWIQDKRNFDYSVLWGLANGQINRRRLFFTNYTGPNVY
ncbi:hypothetical protein C0J52_07045 [Blattella germanica]|nr:hypothetical protein C0J52_07045 [Blattella germanica]